MKFRSDLITNLLCNSGDVVGNLFRSINTKGREGTCICLAQGYGVAETIPVRLLAYAVPVMRLARQMDCASVDFYIAQYGVERANQKTYAENADCVERMLKLYLEERFYVSPAQIMRDKPVDQNLQNTLAVVMHFARKVYVENPQVRTFVEKRGGLSALQYMAEHILYMRDPIDLFGDAKDRLLVPDMSLDYEHIVMIGGPSEEIFYQFRQEILKKMGKHTAWQSHQLFTPVGDPPTYHQYESEPIVGGKLPTTAQELIGNLKNLPNGFGKVRHIVRDYTVLLQDFAGVEKFVLPGEVSRDVLETGYERLKQFLSKI